MRRHMPAAGTTVRPALLALAIAIGAIAPSAAPAAAQDDPFAGFPAPSATVDVPCDAPAVDDDVEAYGATVAAGETVLLRLCVQPSTGFRWENAVSTNQAAAAIVGWTFVGPDAATPGAPGTEEVLVLAQGPGTANIATALTRPWVGSTDSPRVVDLVVTVTGEATVAASPAPDRQAMSKQLRVFVRNQTADFAAVSPPWFDIQPRGTSAIRDGLSSLTIFWRGESVRVSLMFAREAVGSAAHGVRVIAYLDDGSTWDQELTPGHRRASVTVGPASMEAILETWGDSAVVALAVR